MSERKWEITDAKGGAAIPVRVVTRSDVTELAGMTEEGALKVRLIASPAGDPAANTELINFLAGLLEIDTHRVEVVVGEASRDKIISVEGLAVADVESKLGISR
ncbi:hypothetical protein MASR2M15_00150 [Anaerolineales bacterium]